jgi:hypothetical protein
MRRTAILFAVSSLLTGTAFARNLDASEKKLIVETVTKEFKDPAAAQFRWLPITVDNQNSVSSLTYCGMVNGRNSYGAYTGFTPFSVFVAIKNGKIVIAAPLGVGSPGNTIEKAVFKTCMDQGLDPREAS